MQGVLGYEAFEKKLVEIDYVGGSVTFHERRAFRRPRAPRASPSPFASVCQASKFG